MTTNKNTKQEPSSPVSLSSSPPPRVPSHSIQQDKRSSPHCNGNGSKNESKQNPLLLLQQTCNSIGADLSASSQVCQNSIATITMTPNNHCLISNDDELTRQYNRLKRSPTSSDDDLLMPSAKIHKDLKSYSNINNNRQILVSPQIPSPTPDKNINYSNYTSKHQLIKQHHQMQQQQQQQQQQHRHELLSPPNNNYIEYTKPSKSPNKSPNLNKKSPITYQQNPHNIRSVSPPPAKIPRVSSLPPPPPAPTPTNNGKTNNNDGYFNNIRASSANNPHLSVFYDQILTNMYPNQNLNLNSSKIDYANINAAVYAANIAQYNNSTKHNTNSQVNSLKRNSVSPVLPAQRINAHLAALPPNTMCPNPYCSQCLLAAAATAHINNMKKENDNICTIPGCTQCDSIILPKKYNDQHINNNPNGNIPQKQQNGGVHQCCWLVHNNTKCGKLFSTLEDLRAHVTAHTLDKEFLMIAANQSSHLIQQQQQHKQQKPQPQMGLNNPKLINSQQKHHPSEQMKLSNTVIENKQQSEIMNQINSNGLNHYYPYGQQPQQQQQQHLITKSSNNKLSAFKPQQQISKHHHHHHQAQQPQNHHLNPQLSYFQAQQNLYQNSSNNNLLVSQKLPFNNSSPYSSSYLNSLNAITNSNIQNPTVHSGIQLAGGVPASASDSIIYPYANHQYLNSSINPIYDIV